MTEFYYSQTHERQKKGEKGKTIRKSEVRKSLDDTYKRLVRMSALAKYVRTENEAPEALVALNRKIYFVNYNLVELYKRNSERLAENEVIPLLKDVEEDPNSVNVEESKAKLLVACRLTRAYNILLQKRGKINPLILKKICRKRMSKKNKTLSSKGAEIILVQHSLRLCVKALYVAARMEKSHNRGSDNSSLVHWYADDLGVLRRLRLTERLARDLVSSYENESWQPDVSDSTSLVRTIPEPPKCKGRPCHRHRTYQCSYSSLLRELSIALASITQEVVTSPAGKYPKEMSSSLLDLEEDNTTIKLEMSEVITQEVVTSPAGKYPKEMSRELLDSEEDNTRIKLEMSEDLQGDISDVHVPLNSPGTPESEKNNLGEVKTDYATDANEEGFVEVMGDNVNSESSMGENNIYISTADDIRMGDVFWASAGYNPPFDGYSVFDKRGRSLLLADVPCIVVVFADLSHAMHPRVLAIDRYFEKYPCLREGAAMLNVSPEGGLVELALLMVQRSKYCTYVRHRSRLACSLMLRCRPRNLPVCIALDMAGRVSSRDALSDLRAIGPGHALVKWAGRPPLLPAPTLLGFAEYSTDDMVSCHVRPACLTGTWHLPVWRPIVTDRTVFQPATPSLY